MKPMLRTSCLLLLAGLLAACESAGRGSTATTYTQVYAPTGAAQCEGGGTRVPDMAQQLRDQGVAVEMASCGQDGLVRTAVCGAPDGSIGVFVIPQADGQRALQLGFQPFASIPDAIVGPCREQQDNDVGDPDPGAR